MSQPKLHNLTVSSIIDLSDPLLQSSKESLLTIGGQLSDRRLYKGTIECKDMTLKTEKTFGYSRDT